MEETGDQRLQTRGLMDVPLLTCLLWSVMVGRVSGQVTPQTTTPVDDGDFFDDDNNKAMYLVLPAMILIYGGCAMIYCVHRCRQYCVRKTKAKVKEEKRRAKQKERVAFSNQIISSKDPDLPSSSRHADVEQTTNNSLQLESLEEEDEELSLVFKNGRSRSARVRKPRMQETNVDSVVDVLQTDNQQMGAVAPGYADSNLSKEMMHLDNQLKAAFRLTQDASKAAAPETETAKPTTTSTFTFNKNDDFNNDNAKEAAAAAAAPLTAPAPPAKPQEPTINTAGSSQPAASRGIIPIAHDDIESILKIRKKVKKAPPPSASPDENVRSRPDVIARPDENVIAIKRVHIRAPGDRRRVYLSSQ